MKKYFIFGFIIFFNIGSAIGGRGCSCSNEFVPATDAATGAVCTHTGGYTKDAKVYDTDKGMIKTCKESVTPAGCNESCSRYQYSWIKGEGSCVQGKSSADVTLDWNRNSFPASNICWRPKCREPNTYWVMYLDPNGVSASTLNNPSNYEGCEECRFQTVKIVTSDPTEYSYVLE